MKLKTRMSEMQPQAARAAEFLKLLANEHRLMILCTLIEGEQSAGALAEAMALSQSNLSQHLAKLRALDIVATRREGTVIYYRLADTVVIPIVRALYERFCVQPHPTYR